jgi:hypothetical protein
VKCRRWKSEICLEELPQHNRINILKMPYDSVRIATYIACSAHSVKPDTLPGRFRLIIWSHRRSIALPSCSDERLQQLQLPVVIRIQIRILYSVNASLVRFMPVLNDEFVLFLGRLEPLSCPFRSQDASLTESLIRSRSCFSLRRRLKHGSNPPEVLLELNRSAFTPESIESHDHDRAPLAMRHPRTRDLAQSEYKSNMIQYSSSL